MIGRVDRPPAIHAGFCSLRSLPVSCSTPSLHPGLIPQWTVINPWTLKSRRHRLNKHSNTIRHRPRCLPHPHAPLTVWPSLTPSTLGPSRTPTSALPASTSCWRQRQGLERGRRGGVSRTNAVSAMRLPQPQEALALKFETTVSSSSRPSDPDVARIFP